MQHYIKISILLCIYGVFKEFRPAEPYIVPYMTGPPLNFTAEQINHDIFPVSTYSTMASLIVVFLITDLVRYKLIIILQSACMIVSFFLLIYGRGVFQMQIEEIFYGLHMAGEVGYFTYIYAKVDNKHFQEVTSHVRSAYLVGKCLCGIVSQAVVYFDLIQLQGLLWITIGSQIMALIWSVLLPSVDRSIYFHRNFTESDKTNEQHSGMTTHDWKTVGNYMRIDLKTAFTNVYVLKWAVWWALATCCYYMVSAYCQVLWQVVREEAHATDIQYNGAVETVFTLLGALGAMIVGKAKVDWRGWGESLLAVGSLAMAALLYVTSRTSSEIIAYLTIIGLNIIFQIMITVANSEVAKNINRESYGLIFGITSLAVYIIRSIFSYIALQVYRLTIRVQFEAYAIYFGVLGVFFVIVMVLKCFRHKYNTKYSIHEK
uniref:Major facilitator superfamily (MFS) profile domain-containing protein n=1 Tax=Graphocephala atropunctata TaxID=36148 RepID=A0A1B6LXI6_9HEMI